MSGARSVYKGQHAVAMPAAQEALHQSNSKQAFFGVMCSLPFKKSTQTSDIVSESGPQL